MKKYQSGFSAVEVVMMVVIIVLLGAVGWLFWDKIVNKPAGETAASAASTKSPSPSPTVSTKTYTAKGINVAFDYPSTWELSEASDYSFKSDSPIDAHKTVTSPSGFSLVFSTISSSGFGGTGPCPTVTGFKNYGESKLSGAYAVIMDDGIGVDLQLSKNKSEQDQSTNCMYQNIIDVSEPKYSSEDMGYTVVPYSFTFGTYLKYSDYEQGDRVSKPNDKELNEATAILKSVRKV